jgi:hypothetical protein
LQGDVLLDGAEVIAQVQLPGRLHAAENAYGLCHSIRPGYWLLVIGYLLFVTWLFSSNNQ